MNDYSDNTSVHALAFEDPDEFLNATISARRSPDKLEIVYKKVLVSQTLYGSMTVNQLALLLQLCNPGVTWKHIVRTDEFGIYEDLARTNEIARLMLEQMKNEKTLAIIAKMEYPQYGPLTLSLWGLPIAAYRDEIESGYLADNPFIQFSNYLSTLFHDRLTDSPWSISLPLESWGLLKKIARTIIGNWNGGELGAFRVIAEVYLGDRDLTDLSKLDIENLMTALVYCDSVEWCTNEEKGWSCNCKPERLKYNYKLNPSPAINVITDIASVHFYKSYIEENNEEFPIWDIFSGIIQLLKAITDSYVYTTQNEESYLDRVKDTQACLLPNLETLLFELAINYDNDPHYSNGIIGDLYLSVLSFISSGYAPTQSIELNIFWNSDFDTFDEDGHDEGFRSTWKHFVSLAHLFSSEPENKQLFADKQDWLYFRHSVSYLNKRGLYSLSDSLISMVLFYCVIFAKRPVYEPAKLIGMIHDIPDKYRAHINTTTNMLQKHATRNPSIDSAASHFFTLFGAASKERPIEYVFTPVPLDDTELEGRLKEILSNQVWNKLTHDTQGDLIEAEREFELLRAQRYSGQYDKHPKRAVFTHLGCALEWEFKQALNPITDYLALYFEHNQVGRGDRDYWLQTVVKGNLALGNLINLVIQRKSKLRSHPNCLSALNKSQLVRNIFNNKETKNKLMVLAQHYRNPASHASETRLGLTDAFAMRDILYTDGLLRNLVSARIEGPVTLNHPDH